MPKFEEVNVPIGDVEAEACFLAEESARLYGR